MILNFWLLGINFYIKNINNININKNTNIIIHKTEYLNILISCTKSLNSCTGFNFNYASHIPMCDAMYNFWLYTITKFNSIINKL